MTREKRKSVLVIGGGIAGCTVAGQLARSGMTVHIIEKDAAIGGHALHLGCKAGNVCMRCNVCVAGETIRNIRTIPNVIVHTNSEILDISNHNNGAGFSLDFITKDRQVQAVTAVPAGSGSKRNRKAGKTRLGTIECDAVVVATGFEPYNPRENPSYGYGTVTNVVTGLEAERQLATDHRITRVSDGETPKRVAFIQCVGSRTEEVYRRPESADYCSVVCCAYALRIGRLMKHQVKDSRVTVFYMDIQNFGKGFDTFYRECRDTMTFVRSRPYEIKQGAGDTVRIRYALDDNAGRENEGSIREEEFDMAVLAVGMRPPPDGSALAEKLGVPLDEYGFFGLKGPSGLPDLQRRGIYTVGACESPKDIAQSIAQSKAVSTLILSSQ